jgi:ATP-dependent RNA helicase DHX37/DHR1
MKALPYAVALAAALSSESPFLHLDGLSSDLEAGAAAAAAAAAAEQQGDDGAAGGAGTSASKDSSSSTAKMTSKKKAAKAAAAAHARFRSSHGDALSSLNVLCAYEVAVAAGQAEQFCAENVLHVRHLREMSQLRQQLGHMLLQLHKQHMRQQHQQQQQQQQQEEELPLKTASSSSVAAAAEGATYLPPGGVLTGSGSSEALELLQLLMRAVDYVGARQLVAPLADPSSEVLDVLRRAVAAGWSDQVGAAGPEGSEEEEQQQQQQQRRLTL